MDKAAFKALGYTELDALQALCEGDITPEAKAEFKRRALKVLDAGRDHLNSPDCNKSPEEKQALIEEGDALRRILDMVTV